MIEFKTGDKVGHRSGGPTMIVTDVGTYDGSSVEYANTRWWAGTDFKTGSFRPEELETR